MNRNSTPSNNSSEITPVAAQIASDLFENKEETRNVLLHMSIFDAVIGQIRG